MKSMMHLKVQLYNQMKPIKIRDQDQSDLTVTLSDNNTRLGLHVGIHTASVNNAACQPTDTFLETGPRISLRCTIANVSFFLRLPR